MEWMVNRPGFRIGDHIMRRFRVALVLAFAAVVGWGILPTRFGDVAAPARADAGTGEKKVCAECVRDKAAMEKVRCDKCKDAKEQCEACKKKGISLHYLMHGFIQPRLKEINAAKDKRDYAAVGKGALALKKVAADYLEKFLPDPKKDEEGNKVYAEGTKQIGPALDALKAASDKKDIQAVSTAHKLVTGSCMTCHNLFYDRRDKREKEEQERGEKGGGAK